MNNYPVPKHLKEILKPIGDNNEFEVTGKIVCDCGSEEFKIKLVGDDSEYETNKVIRLAEIDDNYYLIVSVKCNNCNKEHLIFDNDFHGWNGFVCGENSKSIAKPETKNWTCKNCYGTNHSMTLLIHSQGQDDFKEEAGDEFDKNDWAEGFSWITIKLACNSCNEKNEEWISYETM